MTTVPSGRGLFFGVLRGACEIALRIADDFPIMKPHPTVFLDVRLTTAKWTWEEINHSEACTCLPPWRKRHLAQAAAIISGVSLIWSPLLALLWKGDANAWACSRRT